MPQPSRRSVVDWLRAALGLKPRNELVSISDPQFMERFAPYIDAAGVPVTESSVFGISAFYRACLIVSGSIGGLPLRTLRDVEGIRTRVNSMFDNPGALIGMQPFVWKQTQVLHRMTWGDAFLRQIRNQAGALVALQPIHPACISVAWDAGAVGGKVYRFRDGSGQQLERDATEITQIMGPSMDGLRGMSVIAQARASLGGAIAADRAAAKMWKDGLLASALVVPEDDYDPVEAKELSDEVTSALTGIENAGGVKTLNRKAKLLQLTLPAKDMQFLESRQFSVQESARWTGVPANLLMDPGAVSTWGTGVEIQNRGLARFTLTGHTLPMQEAYTALLGGTRFTEFDFAGLERGSPQEEIGLLLQQVAAGVMSKEEFRRIRNMGPMDPTHTFVGPAPAPDPTEPTPSDPTGVLRVPAHVGNAIDELRSAA